MSKLNKFARFTRSVQGHTREALRHAAKSKTDPSSFRKANYHDSLFRYTGRVVKRPATRFEKEQTYYDTYASARLRFKP